MSGSQQSHRSIQARGPRQRQELQQRQEPEPQESPTSSTSRPSPESQEPRDPHQARDLRDPADLRGRPVVYMLRCRDDSLYTGWTNDFPQRLASHRSGKGGKYTRSRLPVTPVYLEEVAGRSAALKREAAIKKMTPAGKRALVASDSNVLKKYL